MRKLITCTLLMAFSMLFLLSPVAVAQTGITAQKATEIAKSIVTIPADVKNFRSNYNEYKGRGAWNLYWETAEGNISVNVDALSGEITELYQYKDNSADKASLLPAVDRNAAIKIANEFMAKAIPSKYGALKISEQNDFAIVTSYDQNHTIYYQRIVNNVPCPQNYAYITISGQTGIISNFNLNWDYNLNFAPTTGIISKEKAADSLKDNALELMYYRPYGNNKNQVYLVYGIKQAGNAVVDAHTGEYTELSYYYRAMADKAMGGAGEVANELSPIELKEIDLVKGLIQKEEAINIVNKHIKIPADYKLVQSNLYQDYRESEKRRWSFEWQSTSETRAGYISAALDAKSGELLSFYKPNYSPDRYNEKVNYSYEQAMKIAQDYIASIQPQKAKQIRLNENRQRELLYEIQLKYPNQPENDVKEISFDFTRLVNNIPFYNDSFNISVDLVNGEIISYSYNWSNLKFPNSDNIINKDTAFSKLTAQNVIKLEYLQPSIVYRGETENSKIGLYYHFSATEPRLVDAFKGAVLNNNGEVYKPKTQPTLIDINGHPSKDDINTLLSLGIIAGNEGYFFPDNNITNAEFIKMLVMGIGAYPGEGRKIESLGDEWYSPYYQTAIYRNIISIDNLPIPNEHLKRINAAHMLINAMNLGFIADLDGIYKIPAADANTIAEKNNGYVAITLKLCLVKLNSGKFAPNDIMLRGESASTITQLMRVYKK